MRSLGWCHNGYYNAPPDEVVRRARLAKLDALIIKYGDPAFERAIAAAGIPWGVERFAYAVDAAREGTWLADAVDAGAGFAVANCEPNDHGGWGDAGADAAVRVLIDTFRARHAAVPLYICADLRRGRSLDAPFVVEAATPGPHGGISGWMPMVYPGAFQQSVVRSFTAAYPGPVYRGLPCEPVIQTYGNLGAKTVLEEVTEAARRGAPGLSIYVVETATDEELDAVAWAKPHPALDPKDLVDLGVAYRTGALAILDHGTPAELASWGGLWSHQPPDPGDVGARPAPKDGQARLDYVRGALAILDHGNAGELREWGAKFSRG